VKISTITKKLSTTNCLNRAVDTVVKKILPILLLVVFSTLSGYGKSSSTIVLQLKWKHQFQFAGYYAALEKGFYEKEGLKVEIRELVSNTSAIDEVLSGRANYGVACSDLLVQYMDGKPLVLLAPIFQSSPSVLLVLASSNIYTPNDLVNKTIELSAKGGGTTDILAMLGVEGIKPSQIKAVSASFSLNRLLNGQVDATEAYLTNEPYFLDKFGIPYRVISPKKYGIDFYAECLFTTQDEVKKNPSRVNRFLQASLKGWEYALQNPEEIAKLIQTKYKSTKTTEHLLNEAQRVKEFIQPDFINIGHSNMGRWKQMTEVLLRAGLISKARSLNNFIYEPRSGRSTIAGLPWIAGLFIATIIGLLLLHRWRIKARINKHNLVTHQLREQIDELTLEVNSLRKGLEGMSLRNKELEAFKDMLLANLSFEIRTPLNTIIGYSELLNGPHVKPQQILLYTKEINRSATVLQHQIDNILDLSKLETHQLKLVYQRINLQDLFGTLHALLLNELKIFDKDHIAIQTYIDEEIDFDILSDRNLLRNIFTKLINNSVKFTPKGYIELGCKKMDDSLLHFWVQDSGPGIKDNQPETLYEPFTQTNDSSPYGSLRLGLPVAKRLVDFLNGKIWIETAENLGTTVNIEIPYTPIGTRRKQTGQNSKRFILHEPPQLKDKTILIVEDIHSNYFLLAKMLEDTGCHVVHAKQGIEAVEIFNTNHNIDMVLMDLRLADMDGIEVTRAIRQIDTKVIIVAQTAYSSGVKINLSIEAGCNDFITKPVSRIDLFNILRKYLSPEGST
jgi:signal transduction histidine kinase/CheY-like chemotaxis protein